MKTKEETALEFKKSKSMLKEFLRSFLMPTLIGKSLVLYFGILAYLSIKVILGIMEFLNKFLFL